MDKKTCPQCGKILKPNRRGVFCSRRCVWRAWRQRSIARGYEAKNEQQRAYLADELCRLAAPLCTQAGLARATGSVVRLAPLPGGLLLRTRCAAVLLAAVADTTPHRAASPEDVAGRRRGLMLHRGVVA